MKTPLKYLKAFENFDTPEVPVRPHESSVEHYRYLNLQKLPKGLKIILNQNGDTEMVENGLNIDNFPDYFEDIQGNSDYQFHDDIGNSGFGLTDAPGITDGYYLDDDGNNYTTDHADAKVYYYEPYMLKDFTEELVKNGFVIFDEA